MKILLLTQYFWPEDFRINELAYDLAERGHEIVVLTGLPNYPKGSFFEGYGYFSNLSQEHNRVRVLRCPLVPRGKGRGWQLVLNYVSFALSASVLGPFLCKGRFDAIFVYEPSPITIGIPAVVLKWIKRAPVLFWVQDLWPESLVATGAVRSPVVLKWVRSLTYWIYRHCDRILIQSRAFEAKIIHGHPVLGAKLRDRIRYFPNSAEKLYCSVKPSQEFASKFEFPAGFRIMFAGNIGAAQDFATILGAAERLRENPDIYWLIFGDGREKEWVEREIKRRNLGGAVKLYGRYPLEMMPELFSHANAMLVTLKQDPVFSVTIPAKVQSYMACGKPILAALDGEGNRIISEAGAGLTCPSGNAEALAGIVKQMVALGPDVWSEFSENALRYFKQNFESSRLLDRLEALLSGE
ncbi:MAG TPA: glycosyltransferase family 4 protein [Bdellovibrionota bacterium]|nr:glycosyltransferase family 4 protein [Bdellovibrionota bacterium]